MADASDQQRALEQDLRIQQLEATVEALRNERGALIERNRKLSSAPWRAARALKLRADEARAGLQERRSPYRAPALPLSSLPLAPGSAEPRWSPAVDVDGDVRPAALVDPGADAPVTLAWDLDVPAGSAVRGAVALRPGAWELNRGGVDLVVTVAPIGDGAPVATHVVAVDPAARVADRAWLPWRLAIPGAGSFRVTLRVSLSDRAAPDYAWAVVGEPALEVPGLPRRVAAASPGGAPPDTPVATPEIAILLPVHDPEPGLLDRTLASVAAQTSEHWQLCIVDDCSTDPVVRDRLVRAAAEDRRIRLHRHETAKGISGATNAAFAMATAPFVATLDHDDLLAPDAIARASAELAAFPTTDLLYTDNDLLAGDRHRFAAALKPDWSPDLFRACMYTLHLSVYRRSLIEEIGGWRTDFDGAQDHDLVLRLMERTERIRHLPRILAHWRAHAGSAALGELAKPTAYERGRAAVAEHLERTGHAGASVERLPQAGRYRVRYPRTGAAHVRFVPPAGATQHEIDAVLAATRAVLRDGDTVTAVDRGDPPGGATSAAAEGLPEAGVVVLIDGLAVPADADAIDELAGHVEAGAAAAGGLVVDAAGRVVAGGVAFPEGLPVALHVGADPSAADAHSSLTMVTNRLAVAGAVAFPAAAVPAAATSGAPLSLVAGSLAAAARGRVVWSPHARFTADDRTAAALAIWPVAAAVALDRGSRPDPFWNRQRWAAGTGEVVPESVHENPLLDVVDP